MPTPGKVVSVQQQLVHGFADVHIDYAVDLTDKFFRRDLLGLHIQYNGYPGRGQGRC